MYHPLNLKSRYGTISLGLVIVLLASLHFVRHAQLIVAHDYPAALDPYYFAAASYAVADRLPVAPLDSYMIDNTGNQYPPALYWMIGVISRLGSLDVIDLYRWLGPVVGAMLVPLAYFAFRRLLTPPMALFGATAYAFSPYVFTRTFLTLPENLAVLEFFGLLWLYFGRFSWPKLLVGVSLWLGIFLTHLTALYAPLVFGLWLGQWSLIKKYWRWYTVALASIVTVSFLPPLRDSISTIWQLARTSLIGWSPPSVDFLNQNLSLGLVILASAGLITAAFDLKKPIAKKILTLALPFFLLLLFYKSQIKDFGPIWPERFLLYTAIPAALAAAWLLEVVIKAYNPRRLVLAAGLGITIIVVSFAPSFQWFWPFNDPEVAAAAWLSKNTPPQSVIIAQPLFNWLIRAVGHRSVPWIDADRQPPTIALSTTQAMRDRWGNFSDQPFYIFSSKVKQSNPYPAEFLNGETKPAGYPDRFLPKYNELLFKNLPVVYRDTSVSIYLLNPGRR